MVILDGPNVKDERMNGENRVPDAPQTRISI